MKNNPKISIIGGTIWGNRGAEAMLVTTICQLRQRFPDASFNIFSYYADKDRSLVSDPHIRVYDSSPKALILHHLLGTLIFKVLIIFGIKPSAGKLLKIPSALANSDCLLDIGGITFSDGREKFLPFNILTIWPAIILGTPVVKLAQALGPFKHRLNRNLARIFLSRCKHIFARGKESAAHLAHLSLTDSQSEPAADIAFLYTSDCSLSSENEPRVQELLRGLDRQKQKGKKIIVFSPSILVHAKMAQLGKDYIQQFLSLIQHFGSQDFFYLFLPNSTRETSTEKHNNDILLINHIAARVRQECDQKTAKDAIAFIDFDINTRSIRKLISYADILLTSRYHAMISGLSLSIPTIVIGWSHKYHETMQSFNLSQYVFDINASTPNLSKSIADMLENAFAIKKEIVNRLPEVQNLAQKQYHYLERLLR